MFANDGFKIRGWDETGLHVGSACRFGSSIGTLVTADADGWFTGDLIYGMPISFQLDTGARCNVMSLNTLECTNLNPKLQPSDAPLKSYSGHMIDTVGMVYLGLPYVLFFPDMSSFSILKSPSGRVL